MYLSDAYPLEVKPRGTHGPPGPAVAGPDAASGPTGYPPRTLPHEDIAMRMLLHVKLPHEPFNSAVRKGTVGATIEKILKASRPEAVYFTEFDGRRGAILVVDVADPSKVPALAEPWFLAFSADVSFHIVMSPEELGASGLDAIAKKWA